MSVYEPTLPAAITFDVLYVADGKMIREGPFSDEHIVFWANEVAARADTTLVVVTEHGSPARGPLTTINPAMLHRHPDHADHECENFPDAGDLVMRVYCAVCERMLESPMADLLADAGRPIPAR